MMELVAFIGSDQETWGQVSGLVNHGEWSKIIIIKSSKVTTYPSIPNTQEIIVDTSKPIEELKSFLLTELKDSFAEFEASLSIASGTGKEHMALISALLAIPVGIRFVVYTKKGVQVLN